jgi:chemotaxis protein methyltransferase CheR/type IV pilus assembly protein PilK
MAAADESLPAVWSGLDKLPEMDEEQFDRWVDLLRERTGMCMPRERKSFLVTSVGLRMREVGYEDYDAYRQYLVSGRGGNLEWTTLVDRLTVHETRFFRDAQSVEFVRRDCLPRLMERIRGGEAVQIWSAGCSTGEEAFTLAMILEADLARHGLSGYYGIIGSDISLHSLAAAKQAVYHNRRLMQIPEDLRQRFCEPMGVSRFRMVEELQRRVCFAQSNILDAARAPFAPMDIIYCQNVLIYFDREHRRQILDGLSARLREGGTLVLAPGEVIGWSNPRMERVGGPGVLAFRRVA